MLFVIFPTYFLQNHFVVGILLDNNHWTLTQSLIAGILLDLCWVSIRYRIQKCWAPWFGTTSVSSQIIWLSTVSGNPKNVHFVFNYYWALSMCQCHYWWKWLNYKHLCVCNITQIECLYSVLLVYGHDLIINFWVQYVSQNNFCNMSSNLNRTSLLTVTVTISSQ